MSPPSVADPCAEPWQLVVALAAQQRQAQCFDPGFGRPLQVSLTDDDPGWQCDGRLPPEVAALLDLYAPLLGRPGEPYVMAHLGQSIDGFIAGGDGRSASLNGPENIMHLHRLRALFEVVLIGSNTACADDPRLTTRLVEGPNPTRVVVDRWLRCGGELKLFNDRAAPTLVCCASDAPPKALPAHLQVLRASVDSAAFGLDTVLAMLAERGLRRVFIEGGGQTVSRALRAGLLDRLHVAVAPLMIGDGVPGLRLPELQRFSQALRPRVRRFDMGDDVLFDFNLRVDPS